MSRSRGGSESSSCDTIIRRSTASMPLSTFPWRSMTPPPPVSRSSFSMGAATMARPASNASRTSSLDRLVSAAISSMVGDRPRRWVRVATLWFTSSMSSWSRRGTRTAHRLSRKCRLSSPSIVGVAKLEKARPRSGSKRSTALSKPTSATWRRSSWRSPRPPKRRETASASPMFISMSRSRSRRSSVRRYSTNSAARSCGSVVMSATPCALDQTEVERVAVAVEIVLVDDGGDHGSGELARLRFAARFDRRSGPTDDEPVVVQLEDQLDGAVAVGAHDGVAELVDGDAKILDLVEGQPGAAPGVCGREAREAKEVGLSRDDQSDLDWMLEHVEPLVRPPGVDVPPIVTLVTKRWKAAEIRCPVGSPGLRMES